MIIRKFCSAIKTTRWCWPIWRRLNWSRTSSTTRKNTSQAAVAQSPDDAYNLSILGYLKFRQEKYDEALDALSRAAKLDPQNPEIENYLGVTLGHKGLRAQAETALRKAIQLDPNYGAAHNNLAVIYISQQPPLVGLARWHYQKALDLGQPRNPDLEKMLDDKGRAGQPAVKQTD